MKQDQKPSMCAKNHQILLSQFVDWSNSKFRVSGGLTPTLWAWPPSKLKLNIRPRGAIIRWEKIWRGAVGTWGIRGTISKFCPPGNQPPNILGGHVAPLSKAAVELYKLVNFEVPGAQNSRTVPDQRRRFLYPQANDVTLSNTGDRCK